MKKTIILTIAFVLSCLFVSTSMAEQYVMESTITGMTPIFMVGHEGDPMKIEGFEYHADLSFGGQPIGNGTVQLQLWAPPMNMTVPISWVNVDAKYTFAGLGTIEMHGIGIGYGSSNSVATGEIVFSAAGSVRNGTGGLTGFEGVYSWVGSSNVFTLTGSGTLIFDIP